MSTGRLGAGDTAIQPTIFDAKGDLIVATAADTPARLAVGSANQTLLADSAQSTGIKWGSSPQSLMTTTGDLLYASSANTPARLGIGSTNQVLTVSGGVPTWATASSGMALVTRQTITNSSGTNIDSVFTSTYRTYLVVIEKMNNEGGSGQEDVYLQLRYGTTTQAGNYKYRQVTFGSSYSSTEQNSVSQITLCANAGQGSTASSHFVWFSGLGNSSERANFYGNSVDPNSGTPSYYNGLVNETQTYTGLRLTLSTGNFDATVAIYGLAK